jgi:hypothetical protein
MFFYTDDWSDKAVRRFVKRIGREYISKFLILRYADRKATGKREGFPKETYTLMKRINEFLSQEKKLKIKDLAINGYDVMEVLGISESPLVGKILKEIYALVLSGKIPNERTALLEKLNDYLVKSSSK